MTQNFEAKKRFTEMRTAMLLYTPFFASIMLDMLDLRVGKNDFIRTAGTDGKRVWFDEDFLASLSLPEAVFVCCHEIAHCMWLHLDRGKRYADTGFEGAPFNVDRWNVATDYIINAMLVEAKIGDMPKIGLLSPKYKGNMLAEDVYRDLPTQKGGGGGGGGDDGKGKGPMDQHILAPASTSEAEMKRAMVSAKNQAKAMGKLPANIERWVEEMVKPKVNWKEMLRHAMNFVLGRDTTTWAAPHRRRLVTQKIYLPSYTGFSAGVVVMDVDTSGSMGQREFDAAYAEAAEILTTSRPRKLWLMSCDAKVHDVHELEADTDLYAMKPSLRGGGGTDFRPAFREVENLGIQPDCLIFFTDGYGTFPDVAPPYPVIWLMTTDVAPPFGEAIRVEVADYE